MKKLTWHTTTALALAAGILLAGCSTAPTDSSAQRSGTPAVRGSGLRPGSGRASLKAGNDMWARIRRGYAIADLDTSLVRQQENWYASRPDYLQRMADRSRRYLFHIVEEVERRSMPSELALLPFVESAFNPQAVSSAKAAGLWQFMLATGADYKLRRTHLQDERLDVIKSTDAALNYLEKLHTMFGDWHLALAAYNWGEGNVQRAIDRNRAAGLGTSYLDLSARMPAETRHYVPKLQAVKNIVTNPARFGARIPAIENHPFFESITITHDMDVDVAARLAGVRLEDFKALNPAQRKPIIFAAGTPRILLPWGSGATFRKNLSRTPQSELATWTAWLAPVNLRPAEIAQRFGMDEDELRAINSIPRGMLVKSGSTVLVRRHASAAGAASGSIVNNARLAWVPEVVLRRISIRARKGDTLERIAARHDLPLATVQRWNGGKKSLRVGQAVTMYLPEHTAAAVRSAEAAHAAAQAAAAKAKTSARASAKTARAKDNKRALKTAKAGAKLGSKGTIKLAKAEAKTAKADNSKRTAAAKAPAKSAKDNKTAKTNKAASKTASVKPAKADAKRGSSKPVRKSAAASNVKVATRR